MKSEHLIAFLNSVKCCDEDEKIFYMKCSRIFHNCEIEIPGLGYVDLAEKFKKRTWSSDGKDGLICFACLINLYEIGDKFLNILDKK